MRIKGKHLHHFISDVSIPALAFSLLIMGTLLTGCGNPSLSLGNNNNGEYVQEPNETGISSQTDGQPPKSSTEKPAAGNLELDFAQLDFLMEQAGDITNVSLGSLRLSLPIGWQMEQRISDEGIPLYPGRLPQSMGKRKHHRA